MALGAGYPLRRVGPIAWRRLNRRTKALIDRFDINAAPDDLVRDLSLAARTQVAIARALQDVEDERSVVILDEPTAALPIHEAKFLHEAIRRLAARGHSVILVSHRLDEIVALADRVTILRDGRLFAEHSTDRLTETELIEAILGRPVDQASRPAAPRPGGEALLSVRGFDAGPLQDIDLDIRAGEIVGVAGLLGAGRTELLRALCGELKVNAGTMTLRGHPVRFRRLEDAIKAGVVLIPEDRPNDGAFSDLSVDENMDVSVLSNYWSIRGFNWRRMRRDATSLRLAFRVKSPGGAVAMRALSGGNQQKAILARWLRREPVLMLLDEPTQGVDVGARGDIYALIRRVTDSGGAAVVVASDLEELAQVVDRVVVMRLGRLVAEVTGADISALRLNELIYTEGNGQS